MERVLRTTAEHPFWVRGRGWTATRQLRGGDALRSHDGQWRAVESVRDTGREEVVYNCRVAEYHTYFVGDEQWGFSVWAHNSCGPTGAGAGTNAPRWTLNERVSGQLTDPRMGRLQGRLTTELLNDLANSFTARRFWDARSNNINIIQEVDGRLLRITVARGKFEIISVGPIQERNIVNSIVRGDFIELR